MVCCTPEQRRVLLLAMLNDLTVRALDMSNSDDQEARRAEFDRIEELLTLATALVTEREDEIPAETPARHVLPLLRQGLQRLLDEANKESSSCAFDHELGVCGSAISTLSAVCRVKAE